MSTRIIAFLAGLLSVTAVTAGLYYGTDLLERGRPEPAERAGAETPVQESADPMPDSGAAEDAEVESAAVIPPSFDIVRVEPSGEIVTAGRSATAAEVELLLKDEVIATDTANNDGEWAMVPEQPLPTGSHELVLRATGSEGQGGPVEGDRVTVVIDGEGETPLVAVTPQGAPTKVLQRAEETLVADAGGQGAVYEPVTAPAEAAVAADEPVARGDAGALPDGGEGDPAQVTAPESSGGERIALAVPEAPAGEDSQERQPQQQTAPAGAGEAASAEEAVQAGRQEAAVDDPAPVVSSGKPQKLAIEAVEVEEPGDIHLSGRAEPEASVRLYVNNEHLGDVQSDAEGRWAATVNRAVPPGRYSVRADAVDEEGEVEARSEVRFDRVRIALADETQGEGDASSGSASEPRQAAAAEAGEDGIAQGSAEMHVEAAEVAGDPNAVYIERGDNLWRIARQIYGQGIRYTVIYDANRAQIRDPDLIYPGQVFTIPLPEGAG